MKNRIRTLRKQLGLSQKKLGELVGASRQAIQAIEVGKFEPSIWVAYGIAQVFGRTIEEVFLFADSPIKTRTQGSRLYTGQSQA